MNWSVNSRYASTHIYVQIPHIGILDGKVFLLWLFFRHFRSQYRSFLCDQMPHRRNLRVECVLLCCSNWWWRMNGLMVKMKNRKTDNKLICSAFIQLNTTHYVLCALSNCRWCANLILTRRRLVHPYDLWNVCSSNSNIWRCAILFNL